MVPVLFERSSLPPRETIAVRKCFFIPPAQLPPTAVKLWGSLAFILLILTAFQPLWAAPALKLVSPPQKVPVGDTFTFPVKLEWSAADGPYEIQSDNPLFEKLGLLHQGQSEETTGAGVQTVITLELQALKAGDGRILPFEVRYRKPGTEPWQSMPVPGQKILIFTPFPWHTVTLILMVLAGLGITAGVVVVILKIRKEAARKKAIRPPDPKQRAYARAEELIATYKGETQKETIGHWANHLRQVVMTYYGIPSKTATEPEILAALKSRSLPAGDFAEIASLFREIEQLKFTRQALTVREMESLQKTLLKYVRGKIIIENPSNG